MACRLFSARPLREPMQSYFELYSFSEILIEID